MGVQERCGRRIYAAKSTGDRLDSGCDQGPGFRRICWFVASDGPGRIATWADGAIRGTLLAPPGAADLKTLELRAYHIADDAKEAGYTLYHHATAFPSQEGKFRFDDLPPGTYRIEPNLYESNLPYYTKERTTVDVKPGETAQVAIRLLAGIAVRGRVVDGATGQGIGAVGLWIYRTSDEGRMAESRKAVTDAEGNFIAYAGPGKIRVEVQQAPDEYVRPLRVGDYRTPRESYFPKVEADKDVAWPPIKLERAARLEGIVVNESAHRCPMRKCNAWRLAAFRPICS